MAERFGGLHIYTEQEWLEGDLVMANVYLDNNTFVDQVGYATNVDVMEGIPNVTCLETTFVEHKNRTVLPAGCH